MPLNRRNVLLAGASLPLLASCASPLSNPARIAQLATQPVDEVAQTLGVCSAAYAVLRGGKLVDSVPVSGCSGTQPSGEVIFQAASLTKPLVAYAALLLVLDGTLDLHTPISRYLPQGYVHFHSVLKRAAGDAHDVVPPDVLARLTVAQLLQHASGFPNWSSGALKLETEPGSRWGYSGEGFMLLQAVLEAVTNTKLSVFVEQRVFAPLGMANSSLIWHEGLQARAVRGTTRLGLRPMVQFEHAVAAASLYTTAGDYARFMAALLQNDALLALTIAKPIEVDAALGLQWGLGWGVEEAAGGPYLWQWGNNPGFRAFAMASVTSKDGFVLLTNHDAGMPLAAALAQKFLPAEHKVFQFPWVA
ncbi:beta-lactamase family protein [Lampropedia puyangensis]|uniref:Beta-lactamase family protein n=1 Tax=Lampropedia puyangensis TaxID=1330072 RepID=A0A4S8FDP8_9BURK|nr:serine hydrolase domain-containing protein [Lampropedia puyangensis]THU05095.1 beta-lactamase family protein [Lampropedia puyangensis]